MHRAGIDAILPNTYGADEAAITEPGTAPTTVSRGDLAAGSSAGPAFGSAFGCDPLDVEELGTVADVESFSLACRSATW